MLTKVLAPISVWAHAHGIHHFRSLDDWLILFSLEDELRQHVWMLLELYHDIGIMVNQEKLYLEP